MAWTTTPAGRAFSFATLEGSTYAIRKARAVEGAAAPAAGAEVACTTFGAISPGRHCPFD
jgi:hypothetical protein